MFHVTSIGLDVHAHSVAAAAFNPFTGEVSQRSFGTDAGEIAAWIKGFEDSGACYESGPTGFHLCRELRALGVDCAVAAVSKMQRPAADRRRKNDAADAVFIARMLATHNVVEVWVPGTEVEAARDLDRALDDATADLRRARQRLNMFLIRLGFVWDERDALGRRRGAWARAHWRWIEGVRLEGPQRDALEHYVTCARCAESDRRQPEKRVLSLSRSERWRGVVEALSCIKGIEAPTAFRLAAEAGSFTRFRSAGAFASWCGLVPSEHSSGKAERRGSITKTGSVFARTALVESAWRYASCSPKPKAAPEGSGVPAAVRKRADDATARLSRRFRALRGGGEEPVQSQRRGRPRASMLGLGDRVQGGGPGLLTAPATKPLPPGGAASRRVAGARSRPFLWAAPRAAPVI